RWAATRTWAWPARPPSRPPRRSCRPWTTRAWRPCTASPGRRPLRGVRNYVLGLPLDAASLEEAAAWVLDGLRRGRASGEPGRLVVTLNPEIVVRSRSDHALGEAIRRADLVVADGVGVAWAARRQGVELPGRVPGVDLVQRVLELGGGDVTVYLLGGRPGVAEAAARAVERRYGTRVLGAH